MDMGGHVAEHHRPHRKSAVPPLFGHTGRVDIIGDHRARAMRRRGLTFRQIARERGVSLTRVRASLREASAGDHVENHHRLGLSRRETAAHRVPLGDGGGRAVRETYPVRRQVGQEQIVRHIEPAQSICFGVYSP
jgi:hypothetical protein